MPGISSLPKEMLASMLCGVKLIHFICVEEFLLQHPSAGLVKSIFVPTKITVGPAIS
jgi:hypothetical protein